MLVPGFTLKNYMMLVSYAQLVFIEGGYDIFNLCVRPPDVGLRGDKFQSLSTRKYSL